MRKKRLVILSVLFISAAGIAAWFFLFWRVPHVSGPVRHDVYVWQRAWTQPVRDAVAQHATNFAEIAVLKTEISWNTNRQPQLTRVAVDYETLAKARRPVGIALRIGPYAGPFSSPSPPPKEERAGVRRLSVSNPNVGSNSNPLTPTLSPLGRGEGVNQQRAGSEIGAPQLPNATLALPGKDAAITDYICNVAAGIVNEARTNGVALAELQIDFDCAESKLDGYRVWLEAIQHRVAPVPVTITALPSWLDSRAFKRLAAVATNYVLQVHSVARPKSFDAPFTLCDPGAARRAVESAGRIGVPFRVALPTYGYTLAYDVSGKFIGLSAEGPRPNWPTNALVREVESDAQELAELVRGWTASRPAVMRGVIWYRLPVVTDKHNWNWATLNAVMTGREAGK